MNAVLAVFFTAFMAMFKIFLISCVGVACASFPKDDPLLNRDALRHFSRLNTFVLSPALVIYALGSTLNMQLFIHLSLLFPFGVAIILVSYVFGYILKFIHENNDVLYKSSLVCVGSPNGISLPIMVMASLCENSDVNADYDGDADECFEEASSMMFIYIIPWFLFFWSYGYATLSSIHDEAPEVTPSGDIGDGSSTYPQEKKSFREKYIVIMGKLWLVLRNPALLAVYIGLFIGLTPGLGDYLFNKVTVLQPFGGAVEVLATPVVALNSLVMAASLAHININWAELFPWIFQKQSKGGYACHDSIHNDGGGGVGGGDVPTGEEEGQEEEEQEGWHDMSMSMALTLEEEVEMEVMDLSDVGITRSGCGQTRNRTRSRTSSKNSADYSHSSTSVGDLVTSGEEKREGGNQSGCSLSVDEEEEELLHTAVNDIPQIRSIVFIILCRLIICPLVLILLVYFSIKIGFMPQHLRLMQLLIIIEAAAPPAQMVIVVLNQLGFQNTASTVAYTYVFLYLTSILTITLWSTVAMLLFY